MADTEPQLHIDYDPLTDLLIARFGEPVESDTVVVEGDVAVRMSRETGQPVGIEVVDAAAKWGQPITTALVRQMIMRYGLKAYGVMRRRER